MRYFTNIFTLDIFTGTLIFLVSACFSSFRTVFFCSQRAFTCSGGPLLLSSCRWRSGWEFCCWRVNPEWWSGCLLPKIILDGGQLVLLLSFRRVGDSRGHVPESDKFECFRSKRIIRKYFSCHRFASFSFIRFLPCGWPRVQSA